MVVEPEVAAEAIYEVGPGLKAERYGSRPYGLIAVMKTLLPGVMWRVLSGGISRVATTRTHADPADARPGTGSSGDCLIALTAIQSTGPIFP